MNNIKVTFGNITKVIREPVRDFERLKELIVAAFEIKEENVVSRVKVYYIDQDGDSVKIENEDIQQHGYIKRIIQLSKKLPITYHIAFDIKTTSNIEHILKARDDFLVIYLSKDSMKDTYIISNDKFRDFNRLINVPEFKHIIIKNGSIKEEEVIDPKLFFSTINRPNISNQLYHKITTKKLAKERDISNGIILLDDNKEPNIFIIAD